MKKAIAIILLIVLLVASCSVLAACNKDDGKLHITFYHTMGANLAEVLDRYLENFEAMYSDVKVDHKQVGGYDDVRDQISTEITVGNQPNIAYCYPDHVALYNIARSVQTLDSFIASTEEVTHADGTTEIMGLTQAQVDDFIPGFYSEGRQFGDGLMYSMPFSKSTEVLYYNKTFFEENSLTLPKTWFIEDEDLENGIVSLERVLKQIKEIAPSSTPLGYDSEANWFITMCEQYQSGYTTADGRGAEHFLFDNDTNKAFVKRFAEWYQDGLITTQEIYGKYTSDLFVNQQSYLCIGSSAGASHQVPKKVNDAYPFEVGIVSIPQVNQANPKVISQGPSVCIFKNSNPEKVKYSWLLVKYLTTCVEFQADFSLASGYIPVIKSVADDPTYQDEMALADGYAGLPQTSTIVGLAQEAAYYASPAFYGSSEARDQVGSLIQTVLVNGYTMKGNANALAELINSAFATALTRCTQKVGNK